MNPKNQILLDHEQDSFQKIFVPPTIKPFIKWAGGKSSILSQLKPFFPTEFACYFEPFVGGGAVYFSLSPVGAALSDANEELMNTYKVVRDSPEVLLDALKKLKNEKEEFYKIRAINPLTQSSVERAARLIYLNKTCFNGLYRVNKNGQFNTPYGSNKLTQYVDENNLLLASKLLKGAELRAGDYKNILLELADKNDFVYLDPPYVPVSEYSDFKRYTATQFSNKEQVQLSKIFKALDKKGCKLMLSNSDHPDVRELYKDYIISEIKAPRFINSKGDGRGIVTELVVRNYSTV